MNKYFGDKTFYKEVLLLALPVMLQQLIANLVNMIDTLMVASLGETALAAVSVSNKFFFIATITMFGLASGFGMFITQYYGAKNKEKCQEVFGMSVVVSTIVISLIFLFLVFFPRLTLSIFVKNELTISTGLEYIKYIKYTYIPFALITVFSISLRSIGETKLPMYIGFVPVFFNVFLNWVLIYGHLGAPAMGVEGAALATLIARLIELSVYLFIFVRNKTYFNLNLSILKMSFPLLKRIIIKSLPLMINELVWAFGTTMVFLSYSHVGEHFIPSLTAIDSIMGLVYVSFGGFGAAIGVMVGKRLGANELKEAKENALKLLVTGSIVVAITGIIIAISSPFTPGIFNLEHDNAIMTTKLLLVKGCFSCLYGLTVNVFFTLRAGGDSKSVLILDCLFIWIGPVFVSFILSRFVKMDFLILYIIVESLEIIKFTLAIMLYRKGHWIKNLTTSEIKV